MPNSPEPIYGEIPRGWELIELQDLLFDGRANLQTGPFGTMLHASAYLSTGTPVVAVKNIGQNRLLHNELPRIGNPDAERLARYRLKVGDILFGRKGDVERRALVRPEEEGWIQGSDCIRLRISTEQVDPQFLSYVLGTSEYRAWISRNAQGATMPSLNQEIIGRIPLPLPKAGEQRSIAQVLGALDDKIELNRGMNATLEAVARAIFKSWFVDFDPVHTKAAGRQPFGMDAETAALFPSSFEDSRIGKIPEGFLVAELGSLLDEIETGSRPKGGIGGYAQGVPSIGAESIVGLAKFDFGRTKYVPPEFYSKMTKGKIKSRDVLLYKDGGRPGEYEPHVAMFGDGFPFDEACINEHVYRLRARQPLSQTFLYFWLTSDLALDEMRQKGTGVAIPGLNSTAVRSLTALSPREGISRRYESLCEPMIRAILNNANESCTLANARDALLPKLISGGIRIKDAERMVGEKV